MTPAPPPLSKRERQIMDALYRCGRATANEVIDALGGESGASIRKLIRVLEDKGHVVHDQKGREHVYRPARPRSRARRAAVRHLVDTFFPGAADEAVAAILNASRDRLSPEQARRIARLIARARKQGR